MCIERCITPIIDGDGDGDGDGADLHFLFNNHAVDLS